jgi:hypothetical protein
MAPRFAPWIASCAALVLLATATPARAQGPDPGAIAAGVLYASDRLVVLLEPEAALLAWPAHAEASRARTGAAGASPHAAHAGVPTGLPGLDAAIAALGARLEPEFPGEPPPAADRASAKGATAHPARTPALSAFWIAHLPPGVDPEAARAAVATAPGVERVERIAYTPVALSDSLWSYCWHYHQPSGRTVHVEEVWPHVQGEGTVVGILDTGCLLYHPDLEGVPPGAGGQFYRNPAEAAGVAGVDDDGNGYVDDVRGWDFVHITGADTALARPGEDIRDQDPDPNDMAAHGTAVSGVVASIADNGIGTAGLAPRARILPLRAGFSSIANATGTVDLSAAARGIRYATRLGVTVINASFSTVFQSDLRAAVEEAMAAGVAVVFSAGNNALPHYIPDVTRVIAVGATDPYDRVTAFSSVGPHLDMVAPGVSIPAPTSVRGATTDSIGLRQPSYTSGASGTSFSAPLTAAAIALLQEHRRRSGLGPLSPEDLAFRVRETADDVTADNPGPHLYGSGRLNVSRLVFDPPRTQRLRFADSTIGDAILLATHRGARRLLVASGTGEIVLLEPSSGEVLHRFPLPGRPAGLVAAAELTSGHGPALFVALADGRLWGGRPDGRTLPGWPVVVGSVSPDVDLPAPALGDLDGDGTLEIVWGASSGEVLAFRADGSPVPGFPRRLGSPGRNPPLCLAELDGAPGVEIVALSTLGSVVAVRGDGSLAWTASFGIQPRAPFVAVGGAARETLIVVAGDGVWAIRRDGTLAYNRYTVDQGPEPITAVGDPIPVDFDGDGASEVAVPTFVSTGGGIAALRHDGGALARRDLSMFPSGPIVSGPLRPGGRHGVLLLDRRGDQPSTWYALDHTLADLRSILWREGRSGRFAAFAEHDDDDGMEIAAGAADEGVLYAYDAGPGTTGSTAGGWPMARGNPARTGSTVYAPALGRWDDVAPEPVTDLVAESVVAERAVLRWTAVADDGPDRRPVAYELLVSTAPIDESNAAAADRVPVDPPAAPGETMRAVMLRPGENRDLWFAVRAVDAARNVGPLSNLAAASTPGVRPAPVRDLRAAVAPDSTLALRWTATGDDGVVGRPARYVVRASSNAVAPGHEAEAPVVAVVAAAADAGNPEALTLRPFDPSRGWWATVEAEDARGNRSAASNVASSLARLGGATGVALAPRRQPAEIPVELEWSAGGASASRLRIFDAAGRLVHDRVLSGPDGVARWDGRDRDGRALPPGLYHALLERGGERARARVVLLR